MNLRTQKRLLLLGGILFAGAGLFVGVAAMVTPLPSASPAVPSPGRQDPAVEAAATRTDPEWAELWARRLQGPLPKPPPPAPPDPDTRQAGPPAEPPVEVIPPPPLTVSNIYRSPNSLVVSLKMTTTGDTSRGFVGDVVFASTPVESVIREVDFQKNRVLIQHRNKEFWLDMVVDR